jgi:hypothetical protein
MKIYAIEIQTDLGRRVIQLAAPIDVDAQGDMPPAFRSLAEALWGLLREIADQAPSPTTPMAEA